ncbi:MAG TPA: YwiC-like family protein [Verrucomicrobiae bacterium]|nr:YwiC-like family protein [Verrucomicrobiae bacterium]
MPKQKPRVAAAIEMKMAATTSETVSTRKIIKLILPKEHGSWSLALEPVALGLLTAPTAAGGALAVAAFAGFFLRRPLKIFFREENRERWKTARAAIFILATIAIAGLLLAIKFGGAKNLWPLIPAAVAGMAFAFFDLRNEAREGAAEISGAITFGILPAAFATLAGWNFVAAISLAAVMLARSVPTVLFLRTYLRIKKGKGVKIFPAIFAAIIGFLLIVWLAISKFAPWISVVFVLLMAARTIYLLASRPRFAAKTLGITETTFGATMVLTLAVAWRFFQQQ